MSAAKCWSWKNKLLENNYEDVQLVYSEKYTGCSSKEILLLRNDGGK